MEKTITISKSLVFRNNFCFNLQLFYGGKVTDKKNLIHIYSSETDTVKRMPADEVSTDVTIRENEEIWLTFRSISTRSYTYDDLENGASYELRPKFCNNLWMIGYWGLLIFCVVFFIFDIVKGYNSSPKLLLFISVGYMLISLPLLLRSFFPDKAMRLKRIK